jgi:hypothetical protein
MLQDSIEQETVNFEAVVCRCIVGKATHVTSAHVACADTHLLVRTAPTSLSQHVQGSKGMAAGRTNSSFLLVCQFILCGLFNALRA